MKEHYLLIFVIGFTVVNGSIRDQYDQPNYHHGQNYHNNNHGNKPFNCPDYIQKELENAAKTFAHEVNPAQAIKQEMERQFRSDDWYIFSVKNSKIEDVSFAFDHDWDDKICAIQVGYDVHVLIHED